MFELFKDVHVDWLKNRRIFMVFSTLIMLGGLASAVIRHVVPGGMTGWAQVHGWRGRTSLRKRVQYDLDYIQRWSFWLDFRILAMTFQHVAFAKTSWPAPKGRSPLGALRAGRRPRR